MKQRPEPPAPPRWEGDGRPSACGVPSSQTPRNPGATFCARQNAPSVLHHCIHRGAMLCAEQFFFGTSGGDRRSNFHPETTAVATSDALRKNHASIRVLVHERDVCGVALFRFPRLRGRLFHPHGHSATIGGSRPRRVPL